MNNAYVLKNGNEGNSWNFAQSLPRNFRLRSVVARRLQLRRVEDARRSGVDGGDDASRASRTRRSEQCRRQHSMWSPGHRVYALVNYSREYFSFGARRSRHSGRRGRARNIGVDAAQLRVRGRHERRWRRANDLIYIPRDRVGDELRGVHRRRADVHSRGTGGGVRGVHPAGSVSEQAPRPIRGAQRRADARCCGAST